MEQSSYFFSFIFVFFCTAADRRQAPLISLNILLLIYTLHIHPISHKYQASGNGQQREISDEESSTQYIICLLYTSDAADE